MKYEEVLQHISNSGERLRVRYLYALSDLTPEQLSLFRASWATIATERRRLIIRELAEITERSFAVNFDPIFFMALEDEDCQVRAAAIEGLWENESRSLIAPLIRMMRSDEAEMVRAAAAAALGRFVLLAELEKLDSATGARIEEALRATIANSAETVEVRRRAVESLGYSSKAGVRQIIRAAYESDDEKMRSSAIFAMGRSADPYWRHVLLDELESRNPELRYEAARACGELELACAVPRLGELALHDPDREVQQAAVWALGHIGGREARRILEQCYESDDEVLSDAAADALDEMDVWDGVMFSIPLEDLNEEDEEEAE
ncbi:MAG: HEAT repeat domain-containing protein [Anaerolineae bacterium]|nr:HEAT repeat domain-containing protein [Anaerolineae bacterium]MDW8072079.1 HEAT repeat domain-containing protein [Anaerolineae bacterium]